MNGFTVVFLLVIVAASFTAGWLTRHLADVLYKWSEANKQWKAAVSKFEQQEREVKERIEETRARMRERGTIKS